MSGPCLLAAFVVAAVAHAATPTSEELRAVVRQSMRGLVKEDEYRGDFLFKARNVRKELDSSGRVASQQSHVWERVEIDGFPFGRTLERDGKPLSAQERKEEDEAIQKQLAELKMPGSTLTAGVGGGAKPSRSSKAAKKDEWYLELPEALEYKLVGEETIAGRPTLHLEASPKAGYQAKNLRARVFEKMKAGIWIDKATSELVKADAEMFDTVSVGFGVLGKVEKGTRFRLQRRMLPEGVWLIESQSVRFSARILMVKTVRNESSTEWSDFRRRVTTAAAANTKP